MGVFLDRPASRGATRRTLGLLVAGLLACAGSGCGSDGRPSDAAISVVDDAGRTVALTRPARRVISLIPAQTEIIALLAGPDVLVARTRWDQDPALAHLPSLGNALTPSVEWLVALQPDLVVAWPDAQSRDVVRRLADLGIPVYASSAESTADVHAAIRRLGILLGREPQAAALMRSLDAQLDSVRAVVAQWPERSVLYLLSTDPPMAAGTGTYIDELIGVARGRNVFADLRQLWPQVSLEEIIRRQPDVIIRPTERGGADPLAELRRRAGWRELDAVRAGRVHAVDPDLYNRPGAGMGTAARGLAELIHAGAVDAERRPVDDR